MYGDVKHISVLRTEIDSNEIELDDVEQAAARYSRSGWKKNKYLYTDFQNSKSNDVLTEPYFRPTTSSTTTTTTATPTQAMSGVNRTATTTVRSTSFHQDTNVTIQNIATSINAVYEKITLPSLMAASESIAAQPQRNHSEASPAATISTTLRIFLPAKVPEASITPPQEDDEPADQAGGSGTTESLSAENVSDEIRNELGTDDGNTFAQQVDEEDVTTNPLGTAAKQANRNSIRPSPSLAVEPLKHSQLFQDVVQKEHQPPVVAPANVRGV